MLVIKICIKTELFLNKIMIRVKLIVAYDGTNYCGWQIQDNGITIEEVLNRELTRLLGEEIRIIGASRTDSGVHALGNVAGKIAAFAEKEGLRAHGRSVLVRKEGEV